MSAFKFIVSNRKSYIKILINAIRHLYGFNESVYTTIYENSLWGDDESKSGPGSRIARTSKLVEQLKSIIDQYKITSITDAPCGDGNWMFHANLPLLNYRGCDIVADLIRENKEKHGAPNRDFIHLDMLKTSPPKSDLFLCRDLLIHLSNRQVANCLRNIFASGSSFIAISSSPHVTKNVNIPAGASRPVNLEIEPFNLPKPIRYLEDGIDKNTSRRIGLWRLEDILNHVL